MSEKATIILPACNEVQSLSALLPILLADFPQADILVVDDGSTDGTLELCEKLGVRVVSHPYRMGNGAAVKTGARAAENDILVFMDADGQHDPGDIPRILQQVERGYEMVVGARRWDTHASVGRLLANSVYNRLASFMTGYRIEDLTSGFRAVRARHFRKFLYLLPNGFSYPTTSTMAFFRSGLPVGYVPIRSVSPKGQSHVKLLKDGIRFLVIILKIGALFSPMRLFFPISAGLFSTAMSYYVYTYWTTGRFTNMSALLFVSSLLTFLIGIVSEQISSLHYRGVDLDTRRVIRNRRRSKRDEAENVIRLRD